MCKCKNNNNIFECPQAENIACKYGLSVSRIRELNFISNCIFTAKFSKFPKQASANFNTVVGKIDDMARNKRYKEIDAQNELEKTFAYIKSEFQKTKKLNDEALKNAFRQCSFVGEIPTKTKGGLFKVQGIQLHNIEKMSFSYSKIDSKRNSLKLSNNEVRFLVRLFEELLDD